MVDWARRGRQRATIATLYSVIVIRCNLGGYNLDSDRIAQYLSEQAAISRIIVDAVFSEISEFSRLFGLCVQTLPERKRLDLFSEALFVDKSDVSDSAF